MVLKGPSANSLAVRHQHVPVESVENMAHSFRNVLSKGARVFAMGFIKTAKRARTKESVYDTVPTSQNAKWKAARVSASVMVGVCVMVAKRKTANAKQMDVRKVS